MTSIDTGDLARRALHTFLQSFLAVLGVTWAASGLDVSQITDEASAKKFAVAAVAAVVAAALSAVKTTLVSLFASPTVGLNGSSGQGPGDDAQPQAVGGSGGGTYGAGFTGGIASGGGGTSSSSAHTRVTYTEPEPRHPMPGPGKPEETTP